MYPNKWYTCLLYSFGCKLYFSLNLYSGLVDLATIVITSSLCRLETRILVYQVLRMHVLPKYRFSQMMRRGQYMINMERQGSGVQDLVGQDLMGYCSPHYLSLIIPCSWISGRVGHSVCSSRSCNCHRIDELWVFQIFVIVVCLYLTVQDFVLIYICHSADKSIWYFRVLFWRWNGRHGWYGIWFRFKAKV